MSRTLGMQKWTSRNNPFTQRMYCLLGETMYCLLGETMSPKSLDAELQKVLCATAAAKHKC